MKVQLVNSPLSNQYYDISRSGAYQPLNLISLATYLKSRLPKIEIEILDGDILSKSEILSKINAGIIGLSPKILTYENSLEIAKRAKEKDSLVIMGGAHASAIANEILINRNYIDGIILGDGEIALYEIVKGTSWDKIANLAYRSNGYFKINIKKEIDLNELPFQDNDFIDLTPYFLNFRKNFSRFGFRRAISIYSHKGCLWQINRGGCIFCRKFENNVRAKNPILVWEEINKLVNKYSIDFVWDVSDNLTVDKTWLGEFVRSKPRTIPTAFLVYGRSDQIDKEVAELLTKINCFEVLVGVESGDNLLLQKCNKGITVEESINTAKILKEFGINFYPSLTLGLPGETEETAQKTLELAKRLIEIGNVSQLACSTLIPLPKSTSYKMILKHPILRNKYINKDLLPIEELRRDWVKSFCRVDYSYLEEIMEKILNLVPIKSSFGRLVK